MTRASIIVPVRDAAGDLPALLASVRATRLTGYEIIVVDDASTDGSAAACGEGAGLRVLRLEAQAGPSRARNVGAAAARGDILVFLDADVALPAGKDLLREIVEALEGSPDEDFVVTISGIEPLARGAVAYNYSVYHAYYMERLLGGKEEARGRLMFFTTRLGAIRREKFRLSGGFYESLRTVMNEDGEFGARCWHLGFRGYCRAGFVHSHRYSTGFARFARNYFLTAMVQAFISGKMDTSADPSIGAPEKFRRVLAAALPAALLLDARLGAAALAVLLASFGRLNALVWRSVPLRYRASWYLVYVAITPAILLGYLYGACLHLAGRSPLKGRPSPLSFFEASGA